MEPLIKIASDVSTPLALAGLFAACLLLILRQLIAKNIFPALTKTASANLFRRIVDRLFILSLVATVFGFIGYVISSHRATGEAGGAQYYETHGSQSPILPDNKGTVIINDAAPTNQEKERK
jgi:hypothetical protein